MLRELKNSTEIRAEILRLLSAGHWYHELAFVPRRLRHLREDGCNWELVLVVPTTRFLRLELETAAAEVQRHWNLDHR